MKSVSDINDDNIVVLEIVNHLLKRLFGLLEDFEIAVSQLSEEAVPAL
jgi:hypothetical protein